MLTICLIDANRLYVSHREIEDFDEIPVGWIVADPPANLEAINQREGGTWVVLEEAPPAPPAPYEPIRRSKADFARLFRGAQEIQVNKWEKICKAVPPEEYDDPASALTLTVERVLKSFERPLEFIELNHPETRQGLEILSYVDVFGTDPVFAAAEVERILRGELPE
jgi:hypothetical protein